MAGKKKVALGMVKLSEVLGKVTVSAAGANPASLTKTVTVTAVSARLRTYQGGTEGAVRISLITDGDGPDWMRPLQVVRQRGQGRNWGPWEFAPGGENMRGLIEDQLALLGEHNARLAETCILEALGVPAPEGTTKGARRFANPTKDVPVKAITTGGRVTFDTGKEVASRAPLDNATEA